MRVVALLFFILIFGQSQSFAQDTSVFIENKAVTLREVVVRNHLNVPDFIQRVKNDTTFYKAFLNLKTIGYTSINDIRMLDKKGQTQASLSSRTRQETGHGCRWMKILESTVKGDIYDRDGQYNYYTPQMYASIFFAPDTVCGETNIVAGSSFSTRNKSGLAKHKEQLKMLFFNPGNKIPGLPFISNKIALFDKDVAERYDFIVDMEDFKGENCYVFRIVPLSTASKGDIVINEMTTWFSSENWEITGRSYDLSYNAGVYDFDVHIEVEMAKFGDLLVPKVMRYNGNWDLIFKKREKGVFTATLFDFTANPH